MALGADDTQPALFDHALVTFLPGRPHLVQRHVIGGAQGLDLRIQVAAQNDVGAAPGHVGRYRHRAGTPGLGDDLRLPLVVLGVQHLVFDLLFLQLAGQVFRHLDGNGADQHGLAVLLAGLDVVDDRRELLPRGQVDHVRLVIPDHRQVGRDHHHFQAVDLLEFVGFGIRGAGHAGQFFIQAEVILVGDGRQGLVFVLDGHVFLGLNGLVQAVGPAPARHGPAGKFIDDDHLVVLDDIIDVVMEQGVRPQRRVQVMQDGDVHRVVQAHSRLHDPAFQQQLFHPLMARFRQVGLFALFVEHVVAAVLLLFLQLQAGHNPVHAEVQVGAVIHAS